MIAGHDGSDDALAEKMVLLSGAEISGRKYGEMGLRGLGLMGHDEIFFFFFGAGKGHIEKPIILTFLLFGISRNEPSEHLRWNISMWPK